jgi:hypothetical protein
MFASRPASVGFLSRLRTLVVDSCRGPQTAEQMMTRELISLVKALKKANAWHALELSRQARTGVEKMQQVRERLDRSTPPHNVDASKQSACLLNAMSRLLKTPNFWHGLRMVQSDSILREGWTAQRLYLDALDSMSFAVRHRSLSEKSALDILIGVSGQIPGAPVESLLRVAVTQAHLSNEVLNTVGDVIALVFKSGVEHRTIDRRETVARIEQLLAKGGYGDAGYDNLYRGILDSELATIHLNAQLRALIRAGLLPDLPTMQAILDPDEAQRLDADLRSAKFRLIEEAATSAHASASEEGADASRSVDAIEPFKPSNHVASARRRRISSSDDTVSSLIIDLAASRVVNGAHSRHSSFRTRSDISLSHSASSSYLEGSRGAALSTRRTSSDAPSDVRDLPFAVGFTVGGDPLNWQKDMEREVPKTHDVSLVLRAPVVSRIGSSRSIKKGSDKAGELTSPVADRDRSAHFTPPPAPPAPPVPAVPGCLPFRSSDPTGEGQATSGLSAPDIGASAEKNPNRSIWKVKYAGRSSAWLSYAIRQAN